MPLGAAKRGYANARGFAHELFHRHDTALTPCLLSKLTLSKVRLYSLFKMFEF